MLGPIDLPYLHDDKIGGVLAEGLTVLYNNQPEKPIEYLAKWLLQYSKNQVEKICFLEQLENKVIQKQNHAKKQYEQKQQMELIQKEQLDTKQKEEEYLNYLKNHPYQTELLIEEYPNYIQSKFQLSGVYLCQPSHQRQEVDIDLVDDPNAFINTKSPKQLKYIGTSTNQQFLLNLFLPEQAITTYEVLKPMQPLEDGTIPPNKGQFVPDLTKDKKIYFFRFPQLGCYYTIPIHYETHLFEDAFDAALQNRLKYQGELQQQKEELQNQKNILQEGLESPENTEEDKQQLQIDFDNFVNSQVSPEEPEFLSLKQELILCMDTMGQDRILSQEERSNILAFTQQFSLSITEKQRLILSKDIDIQIAYLNGLPENFYSDIQKQETEYLEPNLEALEEIKENAEKYQYEIDCLRFEFQKHLLQQENFQESFLSLCGRRLVKFEEIYKVAFYLLGFTKQDILIDNKLNWKKVAPMINKDFFERLASLNHKGPKEAPQPYATISRIEHQIDKIDEERVFQLNWALATLLHYIQRYCKLRRQDVEFRTIKFNETKELIKKQQELLIEQNERKDTEIKNAQAAVPEGEEFNEEEWLENWNNENPPIVIPDEPQDEDDLDLE